MKTEYKCKDCLCSIDKPKTGIRYYCDDCKKQRELNWKRSSAKKWREANPEKAVAKRKEQYQKYITPEIKEKRNAKVRLTRIELKKTIIQHYGSGCSCCGENAYEFMCIDHINGGGVKHRKELKKSNVNFYKWIIDNNFPDVLRILCHNCNMALGFFGYCPHQKTTQYA